MLALAKIMELILTHLLMTLVSSRPRWRFATTLIALWMPSLRNSSISRRTLRLNLYDRCTGALLDFTVLMDSSLTTTSPWPLTCRCLPSPAFENFLSHLPHSQASRILDPWKPTCIHVSNLELHVKWFEFRNINFYYVTWWCNKDMFTFGPRSRC